jgi:hypothetical protein
MAKGSASFVADNITNTVSKHTLYGEKSVEHVASLIILLHDAFRKQNGTAR